MGFLKNLKEGLFKSSSNISEGVSNIFLKSKPNEKILEEIEDFMIQCDFGIDVASKFKLILANKKFSEEELKKENFYNIFSEEVTKILQPLEKNIVNTESDFKTIIVCGVNGTGKTTTIGKLSKLFKNHNKKVVIGSFFFLSILKYKISFGSYSKSNQEPLPGIIRQLNKSLPLA